ncbi:uncharacterized protein LOC18436774 [Amborella trichopoda]|uniref:Uncharacterized protein n=1 Tax=Amborella trichopoda TaxID=13333 RepID=W1PN86_AMBTC|nr:uncharacterized protein LOC18436774 [Amborella trichopoda]XP_020524452.1 uncharacterized protein LOC18436774 [Amborella trichopoda]XP_020524453.1 uncharacterized protein LOC18436774 [Amborella trichopoda]ERN08640.1 hypothetical protein AMTR_s00017p00200020 [Amborella trichopoda]|eukprot:XP_020524451.1 uncharacterized protein LOC18436774 [Amborella trichopoda]
MAISLRVFAGEPSSNLRSIPLWDVPRSNFRGCRILQPKLRFKVVGKSLGDRWKITDIDGDMVRSWLLKTQHYLNEVAAPLVNTGQNKKTEVENTQENIDLEDFFMAEQTIDSRTPNGNLSFAAIVSIEQISRMNGLTGRKMQKIFESLAPESIRNDARNLVEYCCFRYLSRDNSVLHPCLKDAAFQRLMFITMLAWEHPYRSDGEPTASSSMTSSIQLVGEEAFVRIAPAISGVADWSTAHHLFNALVGDESVLSLSVWSSFLSELVRVYKGRESYQNQENVKEKLSREAVLCLGSSRKRPVLKWENNIVWPGKLTLTDRALYFEAIGITGHGEPIRLDLTGSMAHVEKSKVGPLGSALFDSAISVSSGSESQTWVLEFVDFAGEMRRDVWYAFVSEIISLHKFIHEYGPEDNDPSLQHVYGAHKGKSKAIRSAANSIARLQSLQFIRRLYKDPANLVQFSYLKDAPDGFIVYQTLALNFWAGPLVTKFRGKDHQFTVGMRQSEDLPGTSQHVFDIDGGIYLRKWMRSPSWAFSESIAFWKNCSVKQGVALGKNLVVADRNLVERAALNCKEKSREVEKTQATIDAAMIKGIPSNVDLFKELILPFTILGESFEKLRCWEEPLSTISFLAFFYTLIFRNLLAYVFPITLMILATTMLLFKGLRAQGRLGRSFGQVTIRDQPPSNTIQKIIAIKEAIADLESYLQKMNVSLLKIRTIIVSGQPQVTTEVALVLCGAATILLMFPFRYVLAFLILDIFTRELDFRKEMVMRFRKFLKDRWATIPATPVVVLPYESGKELNTKASAQDDSRIDVGLSNDKNNENVRTRLN